MRGKVLEPLFVIAAERNVERDDIFHLVLVDGPVANGRTCHCKAMQERLSRLARTTFEHVARAAWKDGVQEATSLLNPRARCLENEMMSEAVTKIGHPGWQ